MMHLDTVKNKSKYIDELIIADIKNTWSKPSKLKTNILPATEYDVGKILLKDVQSDQE